MLDKSEYRYNTYYEQIIKTSNLVYCDNLSDCVNCKSVYYTTVYYYHKELKVVEMDINGW